MAELVDAAAVSKAFEEHKKYFVENNETITKKGVRRYLEAQLGLEKGSIDPHKTLISDLCMKLVDEQAQGGQENQTHGSPSKETAVKKQNREEEEEGEAAAAAEEEEAEASDEGLDEDGEASSEEGEAPEPKKAAKRARKPKEQQGAGKDNKRRKASKPAAAKQSGQGAANSRRVKKLRDMCKAATIPLPPSVFKGQPGEDELCERIEALLEKHGLSSASSAAQVKEVKGFLQKQRELDGIDMSNIIQGRPKRGAAVAAVQTVNRYAASIKKPTAGSEEDDDDDVEEQGEKEEEEVPSNAEDGSDEDAEAEGGSGKDAEARGGPSQRRGAVICDSDDEESGGEEEEAEDEDDEDYDEEGAESDGEEEEEGGDSGDED